MADSYKQLQVWALPHTVGLELTRSLQATFERIILDPKYKQPLVLLKAIRNGAVYGAKVRFPHALVMIFLFRSGTVQEKIKLIYKATRQHARNLALFALLYKSSMLMLRKASGDKQHHSHTFLAGLFGGYWVFGHGKGATSSVNQQIVIYVFARVVLALAKLAVQPPGDNALVGSHYGGHGGAGFLGLNAEQTKAVQRYAWPVFASVSWASVMWLFEGYPDTLQPSLRSSMTYMYVDISFLSSLQKEEDPLYPTDTGLTRTSLIVDMPMQKNGILQETSSGTTNSFTLHLHLTICDIILHSAWRCFHENLGYEMYKRCTYDGRLHSTDRNECIFTMWNYH